MAQPYHLLCVISAYQWIRTFRHSFGQCHWRSPSSAAVAFFCEFSTVFTCSADIPHEVKILYCGLIIKTMKSMKQQKVRNKQNIKNKHHTTAQHGQKEPVLWQPRFHPFGVDKSSTSLSGRGRGGVYSLVSGKREITLCYATPYGKWHPVAVRWCCINSLYMTFNPLTAIRPCGYRQSPVPHPRCQVPIA